MATFGCASRAGKAEIVRKGPIRLPGPYKKNSDNRSFQQSWYERFQWLEYNQETDGGQCFYCKLFKPMNGKNDEFKLGKVSNWKKFIDKARQHEESLEHRHSFMDANKLVEDEDKQQPALPEKILKASDLEKERNRKGVKIMFCIVRWLAAQNLPLRGHKEADGNFQSFLQSFREFMPDLNSFLASCPKNATYMNWSIQNEFIQIIDQLVVDEILKPVIDGKQPFSVIMDETTDLSTKMQVAISIRYVNKGTGVPEEHLVAMVEATSSTGEALTTTLLDLLERLGLGLEQLVGQGYDGGSNMRGDIQGVQRRIRDKCPQAIYTWCWSHSLQLVMSHASERSSPAVDCFNKIKEVYACVASSAQRTGIMEKHLLKEDLPVEETSMEVS